MAEKPLVAIVDDEADMRNSISQWMMLSGFRTETFETAESALKSLGPDFAGVVISDIRMPGMDGMAMLRRLQSVDPSLPIIMITGHGDVAMAVEAMRIGAYDFVEKPFDPERLSDLARRAASARRLTIDNRRLRRELSDGTLLLRKLVGGSQVIEQLRDSILDIAQADGSVLITGETGTGKSLIAQALHACGPRKGKAFVTVNCAAHAEDALEAVLFGPSGVPGERPAVERADGGTLCLEDVEALPAAMQARLLADLAREDDVEAMDSVRNLRIMAISSQVTEPHVPPPGLREDLFFRLSAHHIATPALRDRGEDILMLFTRFCARFAEDYGCDAPEISAEDAALLIQYRWPGNIRQLINVAERAVLQKRRGEVGIANLIPQDEPTMAIPGNVAGKPLKDHVEAFEKMLIDNSLRRNRGAVSSVMDELQLPRRTLNEKMAKYGLSRGEYL
jgi:DNA-binding NtrC family response regulator